MKKSLKNFFLKNWELKLISLLLSFILWLTLVPKVRTYSETILEIPLVPQNIPPTMEIVEKDPSKVEVTVKAPKSIIEQLYTSNVTAILNLENVSPLQEDYTLTKDMISLPKGARVVRINPNSVHVKLEHTQETYLRIKPTIIGELPPNLKLEKIQVVPPVVKVQGPESKIVMGEAITTTPIDISSLTSSTETQPLLILPNPFLRLVSNEVVTVKLTIVPAENTPEESQ